MECSLNTVETEVFRRGNVCKATCLAKLESPDGHPHWAGHRKTRDSPFRVLVVPLTFTQPEHQTKMVLMVITPRRVWALCGSTAWFEDISTDGPR
jgi:hypothetical protein